MRAPAARTRASTTVAWGRRFDSLDLRELYQAVAREARARGVRFGDVDAPGEFAASTRSHG